MKYFPRASLIALSLSLVLSACNADKVAEKAEPAGDAAIAALATERQRVSYMVGLDAAKSMTPIKDEIDIDTVVQAIRTAHAGGKPLIDEAQVNAIRQDFSRQLREKREAEHTALAAKNQQAGDAFMVAHAKQPGIKTTATGLQYQV
ncbi:MAG: FKBP-type peptidyl-prolyl cis-trans isomerase N-terminal domain-containing protein, partial [Lysobacter sp.]